MCARINTFVLAVLVLISMSSCALPGAVPTQAPPPEAAPATAVPEAPPPSAPEATAAPELVQHQQIPEGLPAGRLSQAGDHDSSATAGQRRAPGGDRFSTNAFERPFSAETMDTYYPALDIQETQILSEAPWLFVTIAVKEITPDPDAAVRYAVELDLDLDGRGDWLVLSALPGAAEWTTDGVQVWQDANKNVGGAVPGRPDTVPPNSDGYEVLVFDGGQGDDPDLAWARLDPENPAVVQIAFKDSLLAGDTSYTCGVWAGASLEPGMFELNDYVSKEEAGSSLVEYEYFYPIKGLAALDNTCRMAIGFQATGSEVGLCGGPASGGRCEPPKGGCAEGWDWNPFTCKCEIWN